MEAEQTRMCPVGFRSYNSIAWLWNSSPRTFFSVLTSPEEQTLWVINRKIRISGEGVDFIGVMSLGFGDVNFGGLMEQAGESDVCRVAGNTVWVSAGKLQPPNLVPHLFLIWPAHEPRMVFTFLSS